MLTIWGQKMSSNVQKVTWCCGELGVPFERIDVGGAFGKTKEEPYASLNPNAVVPTIEEDGFVLWESNSIVRYLARKHGGRLIPATLQAQADAERWMDWQLSVLMDPFRTVVVGLLRTPPEKRNNEEIEKARQRFEAAWGILDKALAKRSFIAGEQFSVADIALGTIAYRWFNLEMKRGDLPALKRWYDRLGERAAYKEHVMLGLR